MKNMKNMKKKKSVLLAIVIPIVLLIAVFLADILWLDNIFGATSIPDFITGKGDRFIKVKANPEKGFFVEYFLFIPERAATTEQPFLLVEPNNTGAVSDDHKIHVESAANLIRYGQSNRIANALGIPLLVPCFDRSASLPNMYTHALDRETLLYKEGTLARIDLQLLAMVEDARSVLANRDIQIPDKFLMNGFSASGSFVNRFTALYPEKVAAIAAGGVNGMTILPLSSLQGYKLDYHVGIADIKQIADIDFDLPEFVAVPQYYYMGAEDDNDALPYDDAYDHIQREIIIGILGEDMFVRWENCKKIYESQGINAEFHIYPGIGHEQPLALDGDIISFFMRVIDGYKPT